MIFEGYRARMYSRVQSMASSRNRTVKPWNSIQIEEEDVQFLETLVDSFYRVKNCSWNYATKHAWQAFQFHLHSKDANFVHVTGSIFFQSLQLVLKNRIFEPKSNRKKQPKYPSMESHQHYWSLLFRVFLNKQENFTFLPDRRPSLSNTIVWKQNQGSSLKSTKIFIVDK